MRSRSIQGNFGIFWDVSGSTGGYDMGMGVYAGHMRLKAWGFKVMRFPWLCRCHRVVNNLIQIR